MYELIKHNNYILLKSLFPGINYYKKLLVSSLDSISIKNHIAQKSKYVKKKIFLKGLGYKIIQENDSLVFKLNFSHAVKINIPNFIKKIKISKSYLIIESFDSVLLGNFLEKIYNLRPRNCYKGKGFYLVTKVAPLKAIKKK